MVPINQPLSMRIVKKLLFFVIILWVLGSVVFGENLLAETSALTKVLLVGVVFYVISNGGFREEWQSFPMELRFYEEYMIIYRPIHFYDKRCSRKIIDKIKYSDITQCVYREHSKKIYIYGDMHTTWYKLKKDGTAPDTPGFDKFVTKTVVWFDCRCENEVDIRQVMEEWSPVQVLVESR